MSHRTLNFPKPDPEAMAKDPSCACHRGLKNSNGVLGPIIE